MRIEMAFDELKIKENGYSKVKIFENIKENFSKYNLPCNIANDEVLIESTSNENDYANMWNLIIYYANLEWFIKIANKFRFYNNNKYDDILEDIKDAEVKKLLNQLKG